MPTTIHRVAPLAAALALTLGANAATAAPIAISGTLERGNGPAGPVGRCAALTPPALTIVNNNVGTNVARGTSNLGAFALEASECIRFPPGIGFDGRFEIFFDEGGRIFGTRTSTNTPVGPPGLFDIVGTFLVTGGGGRFAGATGTLIETARLDRSNPVRATTSGTFVGTLEVPAPGMLALFGLGAAGLASRRRA